MACMMAASSTMQNHLDKKDPLDDDLALGHAHRMLVRCQEVLGCIERDRLAPRSAAMEKAAVYCLLLVGCHANVQS